MGTGRNRKGWLWMSILIAGLCMATVSCRTGEDAGAATGTAETGTVGADTSKIPEIPTGKEGLYSHREKCYNTMTYRKEADAAWKPR